MRTVLFVETGSTDGGSFMSLSLMLNELDPERFSPVVAFVNPSRFEAEFAARGIPTYRLFDPALSVRVPWLIRKRFEHLSDRSHARFAPGTAERMLRLAHGPLLRGLRGIVKTHEVDLLYSNNQPNRNLFLAILARDLGLPVAHHLRSMDLDSFGPEKARLVNETATDFFAISDECARRWQERGLDPEKMHTVYNGLPPLSPEPMELTREYGFDPATRVAVIVGKISWEKGHAFLLPALAKLAEKRPECALVVVGEGPRRAEMEALSASLGLQNRVVFTGYSNRATDIIAAADALAQPCMSDSFSRTVIEAMTLGVPVVASDTGGIREVLEDGVNGRLVSYGDEETMTTALEEVLFDDDARVQYADAGMQRAARSFNLSENIRFIAERLERAAGK